FVNRVSDKPVNIAGPICDRAEYVPTPPGTAAPLAGCQCHGQPPASSTCTTSTSFVRFAAGRSILIVLPANSYFSSLPSHISFTDAGLEATPLSVSCSSVGSS